MTRQWDVIVLQIRNSKNIDKAWPIRSQKDEKLDKIIQREAANDPKQYPTPVIRWQAFSVAQPSRYLHDGLYCGVCTPFPQYRLHSPPLCLGLQGHEQRKAHYMPLTLSSQIVPIMHADGTINSAQLINQYQVSSQT